MNLLENPIKPLNLQGSLALTFEKRGHKTVLTNCYQLPPLRASRTLYLHATRASEATLYLVETSGGLVAGDRNNYRIDLKEEADVCLIPQSATKVYPSYDGLWSSQTIDVSIGSKGRLAWKTEAVIPFQKAKFHGQTVIQMAKDATLLWGEILSPGRVKRGEQFQYNDVKTNFQIWMEEDCLIYDALLFSPSQTDLGQLGLLEGHLYVGSLWFVSPSLQSSDMRQLNERLQRFSHITVSATMPEENVLNVRWLASDLVVLRQEMDDTWNTFANDMA